MDLLDHSHIYDLSQKAECLTAENIHNYLSMEIYNLRPFHHWHC